MCEENVAQSNQLAEDIHRPAAEILASWSRLSGSWTLCSPSIGIFGLIQGRVLWWTAGSQTTCEKIQVYEYDEMSSVSYASPTAVLVRTLLATPVAIADN